MEEVEAEEEEGEQTGEKRVEPLKKRGGRKSSRTQWQRETLTSPGLWRLRVRKKKSRKWWLREKRRNER